MHNIYGNRNWFALRIFYRDADVRRNAYKSTIKQKAIIIATGEIIGFQFYFLETVCGETLVTLGKVRETHFSLP